MNATQRLTPTLAHVRDALPIDPNPESYAMANDPKPRTMKPLDPDVVTFGGVTASDLLALTASDPAPAPAAGLPCYCGYCGHGLHPPGGQQGFCDACAVDFVGPAPEPLPEGVINCAWRDGEEG